MVLTTNDCLTQYRLKINRQLEENGVTIKDGTPVKLYCVYFHLMMPVVNITKVTKKHVYDEFGNKHDYPSRSKGYLLCTTASEAWHIYKDKLCLKQEQLDNHYKHEMESLKIAYEILSNCAEEHPEYII